MRSVCCVLLSLFVLGLCGPVAAQESPFRRLAKKHYELGTQYYETSNFKEALVQFEKAYKLQPMPGLLFNMARCHEVLGNLDRAMDHYQRYLTAVPNAPKRAVVEARLQNLKARKAAQTNKPPPSTRPPVTPPVSPRPAVTPPPEVPSPAPASTPAAVPDEPSSPAPRTWRFWAGWGAVGAGGASLVTGVILGVMAKGKGEDYDQAAAGAAPHFGTLEDLQREGEALEAGQIATLVVGGVLVAAGVGLVLWDRMAARGTEHPGATVTLVPTVGPGGGGLACGVRF